MFKNYLLTAIRSLRRNKVFSAVNAIGLSVGFACCLLIGTYVLHQLSYDAFFPEKDKIFRIEQNPTDGKRMAWTGGALGNLLKNELTEDMTAMSRALEVSALLTIPRESEEQETFRTSAFLFAEEGFLEIFPFPMLQGTANGVLESQDKMLISKSSSEKYFGDKSPVGLHVLFDGKFELEIAGVFEDLPDNTHMKFEFLAGLNSWKTNVVGFPSTAEFGSFWWPQVYTYVKLNESTDPKSFETNLAQNMPKYREEEEAAKYAHYLKPIDQIHWDTEIEYDWTPAVSKTSLWIFVAIGAFILILACINYINITTAQALRRSKEIGVRKVCGAQKNQLSMQFLGEALILNAISLLFGLIMLQAIQPYLSSYLGFSKIHVSVMFFKYLWLIVAFWLGVSFLSGFLPSLYLARLRPQLILKNFNLSSGGGQVRKYLVGFQFFLSGVLIFCSLAVYYQYRHLSGLEMGFDETNLMILNTRDLDKTDALMNEIAQLSGVDAVNMSRFIPGIQSGWAPSVEFEGDRPEDIRFMNVQFVGPEFFKFLDVELVSGREILDEPSDLGEFSLMRDQFPQIEGQSALVNESALKILQKNKEEALGSSVRVFTEENGQLFSNYKGKIIGVVKDYHTQDLRYPITPTVFLPINNFTPEYVLVRTENIDSPEFISSLEATWKAIEPFRPFEYSVLQDRIKTQYSEQEKASFLIGLFSLISMIVSGLGIYGLALFVADSKRKEIGIRKVLGAGILSVQKMLFNEFLKPVWLGAAISMPLGYYLVTWWLKQFPEKIAIGPSLFLLTFLISGLIMALTVSWRSYQASMVNPVEVLESD
ncbi:ABC transporter permease [Pararhodonellum marinum]|uniref:ABC transporter permease n=1 Tax=Pararhodonellum marinum TaxID=2755358 RepID=UPI00188E4E2E|nr:ABC transporter permease [Pararhodonellum marinum]